MEPFIYNAHAARVIFGFGTLSQLPAEIEGSDSSVYSYSPRRSRKSDAKELASRLGQRSAGVYANATMHTPVAVTEDALRVVADLRVDGLVAVGGGSTTRSRQGNRAAHGSAADRCTDDVCWVGDDPDPR